MLDGGQVFVTCGAGLMPALDIAAHARADTASATLAHSLNLAVPAVEKIVSS